jgi:HPr kinase/phosphorylase
MLRCGRHVDKPRPACPPSRPSVTQATSFQIHANCVVLDGAGVLLRGASGAGKSDLALRLIERGAVLVADDRVDLVSRGVALIASAPAALRGRMELRGVGIVDMPSMPEAPVVLLVDLVDADAVERLPAPEAVVLLGHAVPRLALPAFEASTPAKIAVALRHGRAAAGRSAA